MPTVVSMVELMFLLFLISRKWSTFRRSKDLFFEKSDDARLDIALCKFQKGVLIAGIALRMNSSTCVIN